VVGGDQVDITLDVQAVYAQAIGQAAQIYVRRYP
jgi:hypothetical protein